MPSVPTLMVPPLLMRLNKSESVPADCVASASLALSVEGFGYKRPIRWRRLPLQLDFLIHDKT
nr:hypothetical protein [Psychrobacter sp. PraFG1]UNK06385.1 hypothetical protein MN210_07640 [Psychrobacter sp. PraFG1]